MISNLRTSLAVLVGVLAAATAVAEKVYITELVYGHVRRIPNTGKLELAEDAMGSGRWVDVDVEFIDQTRRIPAILTHGMTAGIQIEGVGIGETEFLMRIEHPAFRYPDGRVTEEYEETITLMNEGRGCFFEFTYFFDKEYERVTGNWSVSLYHDNELIYRGRFVVYQPWDT